MKANPPNVKIRRARCKQVLAILVNELETVALVREEVHPCIGEFSKGPLELAVVRWNGLEVSLPLECVVFLGDQPYAKRAKEWASNFLAVTGGHQKPSKQKRKCR